MGRPGMLIRIIVLSVGAAYTLALFLTGVTFAPLATRMLSSLPLVAAVFLWLWDSYIWRVAFFQALTRRAYIGGLWSVTYRPTRESHIPDGGNRGPIPGYLIIRQTFWWITVRSYTAQSKSDSRSFFWELRPGNDFATLTFSYENLPKESESSRSTRHLGVNHLDTTSAKPGTVEGSYFTDRYTKGDMRIELVDRSRGYGSFQDALRHHEDHQSSGR